MPGDNSVEQQNINNSPSFFQQGPSLFNFASTSLFSAVNTLSDEALSAESRALVQGVYNLLGNGYHFYNGARDPHTKAGIFRGAAELTIGLLLTGMNVYSLNHQLSDDNAPVFFYVKTSMEMVFKGMERLVTTGYVSTAAVELSRAMMPG